MEIKYFPNNDGVDHINIYSQSQTRLGKLLSNFALTPFVHPLYGRFSSLEGFWYWLSTGLQHDDLRELYGFSAKKIGKQHARVEMNPVGFRKEILRAFKIKLQATEELQQLLSECKLPFTHYYNYGGKLVVPEGNEWQIQGWDYLRKTLQKSWLEGVSRRLKDHQ